MIFSLKVKNEIVKFFDHELIFFKAFVSYVENRVFISRLVVHVKDDVSLRDGHDTRDISWTRFDPIFANRNMHVSRISLKLIHRTKRSQIFSCLRFKGISIVPFQRSTHDPIFEWTCIIFLRLDHFANQFNSFVPLGRKAIDVDTARMHQHAYRIGVWSIGISAKNGPFEQLRVVPLDVLWCDDDLDLGGERGTVWLANW